MYYTKIAIHICLVFGFSTINYAQKNNENIDYVNVFIGTSGHGHTFPGATVPFGLVQLSPDTDDTGWDWCSGYHFQDSTIMGFSHTHLSGTGISDLADILIMPMQHKKHILPGEKNGSEDGFRSKFRHETEMASPGYYSVILDKQGIKAELTADKNTGYHKYTFTEKGSTHILIDLQHGLDRHRTWLTERVLDSEIKVIGKNKITGYRVSSGWSNVQYVYFEIIASKPFENVDIATADILRENSLLGRGRNIKALLNYNLKEGETIEFAVRISTTPFNKPFNWTPQKFVNIKNLAKAAWSKELSSIDIDASDEVKYNFYTALYHTALAPHTLKTASSRNAFDNEMGTLSQWDVYRSAFALNTLIRKPIVNSTMGTMLRAYNKNHYLPVWKLWNDEVNCMIGTPSVPMVVEALSKGFLPNKQKAFEEAILNTLKIDNPVAPWSLFDKYGYVPNDKGELFSVSKTLEMCYAHGCAALLIKKLYPNQKEKYNFHLEKSRNYKNLYDPKIGFFRGKNSMGDFTEPFDPSVTNESEFVEATPWQYLFHVQHDINEMIRLFGGNEKFEQKLDELFKAEKGKIDDHILDITGLIGQYAHGNEPSHHVAYLYNFIDKPYKTQQRVAEICKKFYTNTPDGLCGNEDCGQMSAWYIFSTLGFYPVHPSSGLYDIGIPSVSSAKIKLENGKFFHIKTKNKSHSNVYLNAVYLNKKKLSQPFISHKDLVNGGVLEFEFTDQLVENCFSLNNLKTTIN